MVEARLLGATLGEGWDAMASLPAPVRPGLVIVDGEEELTAMAAKLWPAAAVQRCVFHLSKAVQQLARYTDRVPLAAAKALRVRFGRMLLDAYRSGTPPPRPPPTRPSSPPSTTPGRPLPTTCAPPSPTPSPSSPVPTPGGWSSVTRAGPSSEPACWSGSCGR